MYLFFDTETTGLPIKGQYNNPKHPSTPRLVELGAVLYDKQGNQIDALNEIILPNGFTIPEAASAVHGITTERALDEGIPLGTALLKFDKALKRSKFLIAHNMQYDWLILRREYNELDFTHPTLPLICTKELTTDVCRIPSPWGGFKWPTLQEAHKYLFSEEFDNAHSALADVEACTRIFFELKKQNLIHI